MADSSTKLRIGIIGDPVAHSISPAMQQSALDALGVNATYERWHTPAAELAARIESLRSADVLGANVTVPHKLAVMPLIDEVSETAKRAGAVNTVINRAGRLSGDNTDIYGFATALRQVPSFTAADQAVILGAGGAARAVALALESLGTARIVIVNRGVERARQLARDLEPLKVELADPARLPEILPASRVLINATSLGWHSGETPLPLGLLSAVPDGALVTDLTYRDTDLLVAARRRGLVTMDGLAMLVFQGAHALELWTNQIAPVDVMMQAALAARDART